ncbi:MAG: hypothetical protein WCO57_05585 [Verrucomicrobiota bacterium]
MASQLVYTSAAKLLDAGRSGFGTVARSRLLSPLAVNSIEQVSQFANMRGLDRKRIIHSHRRITAGSNRFHLLSRICDAGSDYTGRTNHIAHHLVVTPEEAARAAARGITPADVLRQFDWLSEWSGAARFFEIAAEVVLDSFEPNGLLSSRQTWNSTTGYPAHARLLACDGAPRTGVIIASENTNRLALMAEALAEFGSQSWSKAFTTSLETTDELSNLEWIVTTPAGFAEIQPRCGSRTIFDLCKPHTLPVPVVPDPVVAAKAQLVNAPTPAPRQHAQKPPLVNVPAPIAGDSGTRLVQVSISTEGSKVTKSNDKLAKPAQHKKTQFILVAGVVAIAAIVGLLVSYIISGDKPIEIQSQPVSGAKNESHDPAPIQGHTERDKIRETLIQECKTEYDPADEFANWVTKHKTTDWVKFVLEANKVIKDMTLSNASEQDSFERFLSSLPNRPEGCAVWFSDLWEGMNILKKIQEKNKGQDLGKEDENFKTRLSELDLAVKHLASASEKLPSLKDAETEVFSNFVSQWLEKALKNPSWVMLSSLIGSDRCWEEKRREELLKIFGKAVSKKTDEQKQQILKLLNENQNDLGEEKYKALVDSIPQEISKQGDVATPREPKTPTVPPAKLGEDAVKELLSSSTAPARQVIIISTIEELKNGVQVELLKGIFPSKAKKVNIGERLKVTTYTRPPVKEKGPVDAPKIKENSLILVGSNEKSYYCKIWDGPKGTPRYFNDGKFSLDMDDVTMVDITFDGKIAIIVVDKTNGDFIAPDLKFKLGKTDKDDHAKVDPSTDANKALINWIKSVTKDKIQILQYEVQPKVAGLTPKLENDSLELEIKPPPPVLRFSTNDSSEVKASLTGVNVKWNVSSSQKTQGEIAKKQSLDTLEKAICTGIGGDAIRLKLGIKGIKEPDQDKAIELAKKDGLKVPDYVTGKDDEKKKKKEEAFLASKHHFGSKKMLDDWVTKQTSGKQKKWDDIKGNLDSLTSFTNGLLAKSDDKPWVFVDELKKIESISVKTSNGLKLFKATQE